MEVIKHGNTYKEVECPGCGALLSYCKGDIKTKFIEEEVFGEWHSSSKKWIICPECKNEIIFSFIIDGEETIK